MGKMAPKRAKRRHSPPSLFSSSSSWATCSNYHGSYGLSFDFVDTMYSDPDIRLSMGRDVIATRRITPEPTDVTGDGYMHCDICC